MGLFKSKKDADDELRMTYKELLKAAKNNKDPNADTKMSLKEEMEVTKATMKERNKLRKLLKKQGIKKFSEFELFAGEVGLSYPEGTTASTVTKIKSKVSQTIATVRSRINIITVLLIALLILGLTLYTAYITEEKGHFTVNVTADMLENGFQLSPDEDFSKNLTRLFATEIQNSNATSIYEINRNVNLLDGPNNGPGYMAYTFYLKNAGTTPTDYTYTVNILSETLHTASATWLMFFEDDKQIVYAEAQENGEPENLYGYRDAPFIENAYDPENQYFYEDGLAGITTTPFLDDYTALKGYVENVEPGEVKKYTVVIWLEGDDPDCNNSILGGHVGFNVQFDRIGEEDKDLLKGIFRLEYDKSYLVEDVPGMDERYSGRGKWIGLTPEAEAEENAKKNKEK